MNFYTLILYWLGINLQPANYNYEEYYESAFKETYQTLWEGTPFDNVGKNNNASIKSLTYYRAMTCFYNSGEADIMDRRALLHTYLSCFFDVSEPNSTLNRYSSIIPIESSIKQVLSRICKLYDDPPERIFSEDNVIQDKLSTLYESIKFDSYMQNLYQKGKLTGNIAVFPKWVNNELHLLSFTPDMYRVDFDESGKNVNKVYYPDYEFINGKSVIVIKTWTNDEYAVTQYGVSVKASAKVVKEEVQPNRYGVIPWVFLTIGAEFYPDTLYELIESQLDANKIEFQSRLDVDFNATPVKIAYNIPKEHIKNSPDSMIDIQGVVKDGVSDLMPPEIKIVPSIAKFEELQDHKQEKLNAMQREQGIPNSMIEGDTNPPSGISRLLEMSELLEKEGNDIPILKSFEKQLLDMIILITNTDMPDMSIAPEKVQDFQIFYPPPAIVIEPEQEYEFDKIKVKDNVMDVEVFVKKHGNIETSTPYNDVKNIIEERKEKYDELDIFSNSAEELETPVMDEIEQQEENIEKEINPILKKEDSEDENT